MNERSLLPTVVAANAAFSAATGVLTAVGAPFLDDRVGAPALVLVALGVGLVGHAGVLVAGARRPARWRDIGRFAVAADLAWCAGAIAVIAATSRLTRSGEVALAAISVPVAVFADLQIVGLRRLAADPADVGSIGTSAAGISGGSGVGR